MNTNRPERDAVSERIIGGAFSVSSVFGGGLLEKICQNAQALERRRAGLTVEHQRGITISDRGTPVEEYFIDLLVEGSVLIQLKIVHALDSAHRAQCINCLRATEREFCLTNFGVSRVEVHRVVHDS